MIDHKRFYDGMDTVAIAEVRTKAATTNTHQVFSQHMGYILGGKATLIVTFDDEPRLTLKDHDAHQRAAVSMAISATRNKQ